MLPIVTPVEMRAVDLAVAPQLDQYIERAGAAVARAAMRMLGGTYGRTVNVIVGVGNNGADGRVAARMLVDRGVKVRVFDVADCPRQLPAADLVIDAAFGTGFHGRWDPPDVGGTRVLAVDLPSGVNALTGSASGPVLPADHTVTFQALKPGLLMPPGSQLVGDLELVDIGLGERVHAHAHAHLVQQSDVASWLPHRPATAHKWRAATRIVAGSVGMTGAAALAAHAAMRSGAGMVQLSAVGCLVTDSSLEVVQRPLQGPVWARALLDSLDRFHSLVIGPGIGRDDTTAKETRAVVLEASVPTVVDGDGLFAMAWNAEGAGALLRRRTMPTVLTPHDGEYHLLTGSPPAPDRFVAARRLATDTGCVVLLKGPATVVAEPDGRVLVITTGDERLATAGSGDVLAGIIGGLLAQGMAPFHAAASSAWLHGRASRRAPAFGMVAGDIADHLPAVFEELA
ncbi:MAG: NAD(P)H-hydrate dehydratase [Actinobacteria bacterium]|nr:NAD(P)H-hydrate dehydratase [Actinomycetota bacterium]